MLITGFHWMAESVAIADSDPTAGYGSSAAQLAGVAIHRCDADEGSDTTAIELAEFG